jgi:hypothetical protein
VEKVTKNNMKKFTLSLGKKIYSDGRKKGKRKKKCLECQKRKSVTEGDGNMSRRKVQIDEGMYLQVEKER